MAEREELILEVRAELDRAKNDVEDLERQLKELEDPDPIELKVDAEVAQADIEGLGEDLKAIEDQDIELKVDTETAQADVKGLGEDLKAIEDEDITLKVDTEAAQAGVADLGSDLDAIGNRGIAVTADTSEAQAAIHGLIGDWDAVTAAARETTAIAGRLGDALGVDASKFDLKRIAQEMQQAGVGANDLEAELDQVVASLKRMGDARTEAEQVSNSLRKVSDAGNQTSQSVRNLGDTSNQSRSVLANLAGNAAQDLGQLGGVVGSLGVGIGQLAEYAVDGNIKLNQLAAVAGPMLALSAALALVQQNQAEIAAQDAFHEENVKAYKDAIDELGPSIEAVQERLQSLEDLPSVDATFGLDKLGELIAGLGIDLQEGLTPFENLQATIGNVPAVLGSLGVSFEDVARVIQGPRVELLAFTEALNLLPEAESLSGPIIAFLTEQRQAYADAIGINVDLLGDEAEMTRRAAEEAEFYATSAEGISDAMRGLNEEQLATSDAWDVVIEALRTGGIETQVQVDAWNQLRDILHLTDAEMAALSVDKLEERLRGETEATRDAADAQREAIDVQREYADQIFGTNAIRDAQRSANEANAAQLEAETQATHDAIETQREYADQIFGTNAIRDAQRIANEANAAQLEAETEATREAIDVQREYADQIFGTNAIRDAQRSANEMNAEQLQAEADAAEAAAEAVVAAAEAEREHAEALRETSDELETMVAGFDDVSRRADAVSTAFDELNRSSELTMSQEVVDFVGNMNALRDALKAAADEGINLNEIDLVPDSWEEVLNMPEELGPVQDALVAFRESIQSEMAQAFEQGGSAEAQQWAENTRDAITTSLREAGVTSQDAINQILSALGLLPDQVDVTINVSNAEVARQIISDIGTAIDTLPTEVQLEIAAVAVEDPVAALELAIEALQAQGVEIPASLVFAAAEIGANIDNAVPDGIDVPVNLVSPPFNESDLAALVGIADVEITTSQDGVAFDEIDDLVDDTRTATVDTDADLAGITDIDNAVAEQRTADVDVNALLGGFEREMLFAIRTRTTTVNVDTGSIDMPSNSQLRNMIGTVRVPVQLYYNTRIEGSRPR